MLCLEDNVTFVHGSCEIGKPMCVRYLAELHHWRHVVPECSPRENRRMFALFKKITAVLVFWAFLDPDPLVLCLVYDFIFRIRGSATLENSNWQKSWTGSCLAGGDDDMRVTPPRNICRHVLSTKHSSVRQIRLASSYLWTCDLYGPIRNAFDAGISITRASRRGLGPGNRYFFGLCEMALSR
jgi:hypothetical protein